jgi:CDP-diacylglycerol--glycerol-3-phosphate 3-phosphatidyltransferase
MKKSGVVHLFREDENKYALPNFFTLMRLVFLPFIIYFLYRGTRTGDVAALFFMSLACVTDYLDGHFARKLNKVSNVGRMLDPLIDKISVGAAMIVLAHVKGLPYWYVAAVITRDLFLLVSGIMVISKKRFITESNKIGKWTSTLFAMVIITFTLNVPVVKYVFMYLTLVLIPITIIGYVKKYKRDVNQNIETQM